LENIYDSQRDLYIIKPFPFQPFSEKQIQALTKLPDNELLQYTSTSPLVESHRFVPNIRELLKFFKQNDWIKFFDGKARTYKREHGKWVKV